MCAQRESGSKRVAVSARAYRRAEGKRGRSATHKRVFLAPLLALLGETAAADSAGLQRGRRREASGASQRWASEEARASRGGHTMLSGWDWDARRGGRAWLA